MHTQVSHIFNTDFRHFCPQQVQSLDTPEVLKLYHLAVSTAVERKHLSGCGYHLNLAGTAWLTGGAVGVKNLLLLLAEQSCLRYLPFL